MSEYIFEMQHVTKRFASNIVLNSIDLSFRIGEVHAIIGENGAGKSTLIKIMSGVYQPDEGKLIYKNQPVRFTSPSDAQNMGIATLFQEIQEIPDMSVSENIFLAREFSSTPVGIIKNKKMKTDAMNLINSLGLNIDVNEKMKNLPVSSRKMIEIIRAVRHEASIVIMDEPTANLNLREMEILFKIIAELKAKGKTIIYISHRMSEILTLADRITVLRDGNLVKTLEKHEYQSENDLIPLMIGRKLEELYPIRNQCIGDDVLSGQNIFVGDKLRSASFSIKKGEIVGFAGLESSGANILTKALFGLNKASKGSFTLESKPFKPKSPAESIARGIAFVPEDRKTQGLFLDHSIVNNITISTLPSLFSKRSILKRDLEISISQKIVEMLSIKTPSIFANPMQLSGGNQQKVLIGRWMLDKYKLLILEEPTRGVDVGAKSDIYQQICHLAENGLAIILFSTDMSELMGLCDRIIVFSAGEITANLNIREASQQNVLEHALRGYGYEKKD